MKVIRTIPPRLFTVGSHNDITLKDCAHIELEANEQVSFTTTSGNEYDVVRKAWGYYATPSLNGRLRQFGLRAVLVKSSTPAKYFILLVESSKETEFTNYLDREGQTIVAWLDRDQDLEAIEEQLKCPQHETEVGLIKCPFDGTPLAKAHTYHAPPKGETRFSSILPGQYKRCLLQCQLCGHFVSVHDMNFSSLYTNDYVNATYQDEAGIRQTFEKITSLDPSQSDNCGRVRRVLDFASVHFQGSRALGHSPSILDVGSGVGVFAYKIKERGWDCTALDPDPRAVNHALKTVGVKAVGGDFMEVGDIGSFDVVTFNKVLEHVKDPIAMLGKSRNHLNKEGFVYVEVPDGAAAIDESLEREEFFIEHHHVFSPASLSLLVARCGFSLQVLERLREPSTKFTLRAFITRGD